MSIERVRAYLRKYGAEDKILEFSQSSATVELAAEAVGVIPARIAKSMGCMLKDGSAVLIVTAGDSRIDNHKYKAFFGEKARMMTPEETLERLGHAVGGVCPFALPEGVRVVLDESLKRFETVFPACGSSNSAIEVSPGELSRLSGSDEWVEVCSVRE